MLKQAARKHPEVPCLLQPLTAISAIAAFDGVLCVDAMEYVPPEEWPIVLAAFHRALRPGGHLYITVEQADPAVIEAETRRSAALGHPVVPGESVQGAGPEENDGYHFYPAHDRVLGWLAGAGFRLLEERLGDEYVHLLAQSA
jgi:SAM-dependent methyltransferase